MPMTKYEFELSRQRWDTLDKAIGSLCKWGPLCVIAYFGYLSIATLAGHSTLAEFGVRVIADLKVNNVVSHLVTALFGVGGISYGYSERRLRHKNIERMSEQLTEYEKLIDPKRSTSGLTKRGRTRPEDAR
jgi:hypothetical protein